MYDDARPIEVLLVEDNTGDARLTVEAMREGRVLNNLTIANDGEQAMAMLRGEGEFHGRRAPDMVLLDLNLPKKDGREVLAEIKADEKLRRIPVVILTTSRAEEDILRTYNLHANCYITKPVDLDQFIRVVRSISEFWFEVVRLPQTAS